MKKNLVVFYSQTGQLKEILNNVFKESQDYIEYVEIEAPQITFPLNWESMFELFPESVLKIPCEITYNISNIEDYDTIILGFQTWFLHLSQPMLAFSQTKEFANLVKGKNVYLIMDCRNSWKLPMEYMQNKVISCGGYIKGQCVFSSKNSNFLGALSILHWFFTGNKKSIFFPEPGVPQAEINKSVEYGKSLFTVEQKKEVLHYPSGKHHFLPPRIEAFAMNSFKKWAVYVTADKNEHRKKRLIYFKIWLLMTLISLSPFIIISKLIHKLNK